MADGCAWVPEHPLGELLTEALAGRYPDPDGGWCRLPPWRDGLEGVVAFTGHTVLVVASDVTDEGLEALTIEGGGAHDPRVVVELAGSSGWIDSPNLLLVAAGTGPRRGVLVERDDLAAEPRVTRARELRSDLRVFGLQDPARRSCVVLASGIGGLVELSFEVDAADRGGGVGRAMVRAALGRIPRGKPVIAACAPSNAASLRCLLAAGFNPVGSVQLFRRARECQGLGRPTEGEL